jgi:hypothetical protein
MITFYITWKGIGGVQNLFLNLTKELYKRGICVKFIYFKETWLIEELDKEGVEYELFDLENDNRELISNFINKDDVIILSPDSFIIEEMYQIKPYFLFWVVHPKTFIRKLFPIKKIMIKLMIEMMIKRGGLYFMDKTCLEDISKYFYLTVNDNYLPIPVIGIEKSNSSILKSLIEKKNRDIISLSYIGRAEIWKVNPVKKIISDLLIIRGIDKKEFRLHIFTDNVDEFEQLLSYSSNEIEIIYHSNIFGAELDQFIKKEILINFAMGTSCLESAKLGIPSILVDCSYDTYPESYKYNWIYNSEGFSLGKVLDKNYISMNGYTLLEIFKQIFHNESFICDISNSCLEYTSKNHDIETITSLLLEKTVLCHNKMTPNIRHSFFHSFSLLR